jgi:hypothetical protein
MATVYTFLVKNAGGAGGGDNVITPQGEIVPRKGAGNKGGFFTGSNRGVEHNRYSRAFNPILNSMTGGVWEKGVRLSRAGTGIIDTWKNSGWKAALTGVGFVIVAQFAALEIYKGIKQEIKKANEANQTNFLKIKSGMLLLNRNDTFQKRLFGRLDVRKQ